ncbi:MAG TPA: TonB-dependent receptor [Steroidobacteraceae bacterium]|nr:TonB-dependent receptor [Steroidobacteraceae bacterium]
MTRFDYDVRHPRAIFRLWVLRSMAGSALLAGSAFAVVHAQDPAGHTSAGIEEVVVTASKRGEQNVQDVSMSIAAFDEASLRARGADNFLDYARAVPGLSVQDQGPGDKKYVIRGVQSVGAATTGLYFDEIVMTANNRQDGGGRQPDLKLFDIERVEVLRGPQGTLYGASSMSGTIRIVANKPDASEFAGRVEGTVSQTRFGNENYRLNAMVNVPVVADKFAVRGVYYLRDESGFIDNVRLGLKGINDEETSGGRLAARLWATDRLTLTATGLYQKTESNGRYGYEPSTGELEVGFYTKTPWTDEFHAVNLTAEQQLDSGTLLFTSSWFDRDINFNNDGTTILAGILGRAPENARSLLAQPQSRSIWSNELRYSSNWQGPFNLVGGVFFQKEKSNFNSRVDSADANGVAEANPIVYLWRSIDTEIENRSLFGELSYDLTSKLTATVGARWFQFDVDEQSSLMIACCSGNTPGPGPAAPTASSDKDVNYKLNLSYEVNDDLLFYAQAAQGFRSGGNNEPGISVVPGCQNASSFSSDGLWNYEIGAKMALLDNRAVVNLTPYYIDWSDMQVRAFNPLCNNARIANAGEARIQGVEAEVVLRPVAALQFNLTFNYSDAELTEDQPRATGTGNGTEGRKGDDIPGVPRTSSSAGVQYSFPVRNASLEGVLRGDYSYVGSSKTAFRPLTDPTYRVQPSYALTNLRFSLVGASWETSLFMNNVFDERAEVTHLVFSQTRPDIIITNRPREVGISFSKSF